jgi:hypothetical protein
MTVAGENVEPPAALRSSSSSWISAAGFREEVELLEDADEDVVVDVDGPEGWEGFDGCGRCAAG